MSQYICPHCGTIPCECDMSNNARLIRCLESNRQLREELERVKASLICQMETVKRCAEIIIYERKLNTDLRATLAAAKEALGKVMSEHSMTMQEVSEIGHSEGFALKPSLFDSVRNALARIAECEKGT